MRLEGNIAQYDVIAHDRVGGNLHRVVGDVPDDIAFNDVLCAVTNGAVKENSRVIGIVDDVVANNVAVTALLDFDAITLPLCQRVIDEMFLLSEDEIKEAIRTIFDHHRLVAEGSAAMSVGALLKHPERFAGKNVVLVLCGRNIDMAKLREIIAA